MTTTRKKAIKRTTTAKKRTTTAKKRTTAAKKRSATKLFNGVRIPSGMYRKIRYYDAWLRVNKARKSGSIKAREQAYKDLYLYEPPGCEYWSGTRYSAYILTAHATYSKFFKAPPLKKPASGFYQP